MGDIQRGRRLRPELISAAGPSTPFAPRAAKAFAGAFLICAGCAISWALGKFSSLSVTVSILVGLLCAWWLDGKGLLWLWSETLGRPRRAAVIWGLGSIGRSAGRELVPASTLDPGDLICDHDAYEAKAREADRLNQRARDDLERLRTSTSDESLYDSIVRSSPGHFNLDLTALPWRDPEMRFHQLLASLPSPDGVTLALGLINENPVRVSLNKLYYRWRGGILASPPSQSRAIVGDLIDELPHNLRTRRERDLVLNLLGKGHTEQDAWQAIRAALAVQLISIHRTSGWFIEAPLAVFMPRATKAGHQDCSIGLTDLGRIWAEAGDRRDISAAVYQEFIGGDKIMGDKYEVGNAGAVGPSARAENVTFNQAWPYFQIGNQQILTQELMQLLAALQADAASAKRHPATIDAVRAAKGAAETGDARLVMTHLAQAGKWALDVATSIGATIAAAAIQRALGI